MFKALVGIIAALALAFSAHAQVVGSIGGVPTQPYNPSQFSFLGDSRVAYLTDTTGYATIAQQWFNAANARAGHRYVIGTNAGNPSCRSDQFLAPVNLNAVISDSSQFVIINSPGVNDFLPQTGNGVPASLRAQCSSNVVATFPYTNNNGVVVTATNVGSVVASNVVAAAERIIAAGKVVILTEEPGATTMVASVNQLYDLNQRLEAYAASRPGRVYIWSYNQVVWAPTSSATAVAFKAGYSTDGIHFSQQGADPSGVAFNTFFSSIIPAADISIANINFLNSTTARSLLVTNPLFTTLTGGTAPSGCSTVTGNTPLGWQLTCNNAATTATITSAADPNGYGNQITLAITTTGADTAVTFQTAVIGSGAWNLTDYFAAGADISVAAGSSHAACYLQMYMQTDAGISNLFDMLPNGSGDFTSSAYAYRLKTPIKPVLPGSTTKTGIIPAMIICAFSAAGNATITISRVWSARMYNYNPATGAFAGQ